MRTLGGCRTWSVEAKIGPSEDSFAGFAAPYELWGKKTVKNGPLRPNLQPTISKSDSLLAIQAHL